MRMIIGGSFQGKETFVINDLKFAYPLLDGEQCSYEEIFSCKGIKDLHMFIKRFLDHPDLDLLAEELFDKNPDILIISDEIGYGIVPIDRTERLWREKTGRICCQLMQHTDTCYRVVAGLGTKIKG